MFDLELFQRACWQALLQRQRPDGGWAFSPNSPQSALEPTALALLALPQCLTEPRQAASSFLSREQNGNGSWPAFVGDQAGGSGVTGLVVHSLMHSNAKHSSIDRAIRWLLNSRGQEAHWLWKWKFRTSDRHVRFDPSKFGWPWIPGTVSWVVPTAYSLLALQPRLSSEANPKVKLRIDRGVEMLFDRMCPEGGWNSGNGVVYGHMLAPHPDATAIALLVLKNVLLNDSVTRSLDWLESRAQDLSGQWSLAWTTLALDAFHRPVSFLTHKLLEGPDPAAVQDCATLAIVSIALRTSEGTNVFGGN